MNQNKQKISLVGVGRVGSTLALTLLIKDLAKEIVLIGEDIHRAQGEAYDLIHASSFANPLKIYAGSIEATSYSDIIIVSASVPMKNMKNRLDLGTGNVKLFRNLKDY